jgi:hypothetical protein
MAYFMVMGGLVLAVCVGAGWTTWRIIRWAWTGATRGASGKRSRGKSAGQGRAASRQPSTKQASAKATPSQKGRGAAASRRDKPAQPSSPWRLTMALAGLRGAWPLAMLAGALYGGARLVAHGMAARPQSLPEAFLALVEALGWGAAGLCGLALVGLLATWRCRRG